MSRESGHWVTIDGTHVFIQDGKITKGPKNLVGYKPKSKSKSKSGEPVIMGVSHSRKEPRKDRRLPIGFFMAKNGDRYDDWVKERKKELDYLEKHPPKKIDFDQKPKTRKVDGKKVTTKSYKTSSKDENKPAFKTANKKKK